MNRHRVHLTCSLMALLSAPLFASWEDGVAAFRAGRYEDAAAVFESFVSASPQAPEGYYMLGLSLMRQERLKDALGPLAEAVALAGNDVSYRLTLAQALLKAGKPADAFTALEAQDPAAVDKTSRASFNQLLAKAANGSGRDRAAFASIEKALAADGKSKALWLARANLAGRLDRPEDVFAARVAAFEIDPSDPEPGVLGVHAAMDLAQAPDAGDGKLEWYGKAAQLADRLTAAFPTPENLRLAAAANMGAHQYERSIGYLERDLATDGRDPLLHFDLGRCRQALGQNRQALDDFAAALERSPDAQLATAIQAKRGASLRALEEFDAAAAAYRQAGDAETAAEMAGYAKNRREYEAAKDDCVKKRKGLQEILASSEGLEHTPEYKEIQQDLATILDVCKSYFNDEA
jgi:tetratricopeptide (TPR) repeat protein